MKVYRAFINPEWRTLEMLENAERSIHVAVRQSPEGDAPPILDVGWVIARRLFFEKRSPALGDDKHLHFRLLSAGFSHRKAVLLLWGLSAFFGALSLFLQTEGKVYLLVVMLLVMIMLGLWVTRRSKSSASQSSRPS